jgi:hypothetical protein
LPRKLNDANLVLVKKDEEKKDEPETLQQLAQEMHDKETKKPEQKGVATANNPEGAKVVRSAEEKAKTKRAYNKKSNKRSEAAMKRYLSELGQVAAESPTLMQPVVPGPGVSQAEVDEKMMEFALKLAKLLQGVM